jgi:hypothetical protein
MSCRVIAPPTRLEAALRPRDPARAAHDLPGHRGPAGRDAACTHRPRLLPRHLARRASLLHGRHRFDRRAARAEGPGCRVRLALAPRGRREGERAHRREARDRLSPPGGRARAVFGRGHRSAAGRDAPDRRTRRAAAPGELPVAEFRARRQQAMRRLPDGILLVAASPFLFDGDQVYLPRFSRTRRSSTSPALRLPGAVLALDGPRSRAVLFAPAKLPSFDAMLSTVRIAAGPDSAARLGVVDEVLDRKELAPWLTRRWTRRPGLLLYAPASPRARPGFPLDAASTIRRRRSGTTRSPSCGPRDACAARTPPSASCARSRVPAEDRRHAPGRRRERRRAEGGSRRALPRPAPA